MALWLRCEVSRGQFNNEVAVSGQTYDGRGFSLFISGEFVEVEHEGSIGADEPVNGYVRVDQLDRKGSLVLVKLPGQTFENGRTITVHEQQLSMRDSRQNV